MQLLIYIHPVETVLYRITPPNFALQSCIILLKLISENTTIHHPVHNSSTVTLGWNFSISLYYEMFTIEVIHEEHVLHT